MKQGWITKTLGEVSSVSSGNSAPQDKRYFIDGIYPFFRTSDVGRLHIHPAICTSLDNLNQAGIKGLRLFKKGTILFPKSGASTFIDHRVKMGVDGYVSSHLATIKAIESLLLDSFLYFYLQKVKAKDLIQDISYPSLNISTIKQIPIPLPPLSEQQRIVAILNQAFDAIERARSNTEKNLANARELFESTLNAIFFNPGVGWCERKLGNILEKTETVNPRLTPNDEFLYIDVSSVSNKSFTIENANKILGKNAPSRARKLIETGDIIFATVRPTLQRISKITKEYDKQVCSTGFFVLRTKKEVFNNFLFYYLFTDSFKNKVEKLQRGTSYPAVTDSDIRNHNISYPSLSEQQHIVAKLDALSAETLKLEALYQQKLADLDELKRSILQKAFNGEL